MAFAEVKKSPTRAEISEVRRQYNLADKTYQRLKYQFQDKIEWDDISKLSVNDFLELKEAEILKRQLYWKLHELEHPNDKATREAYRFLNRMDHNGQVDFLASHGLMSTHDLIDRINKNPNFLSEVTA